MAEPAPPAGPLNLLRPLLLMAFAAAYLPPTLYTLLTTGQFRTLLDPSAVRDAWFARFWGFFGPRSRDMAAPHVTPLLQHAARGVCLDIGPGAGEWLYLFQRARNPHVRKIYGIEPNREMHAALRANAARAGLDGVYEVVGCGAEELRGREGWQAETVDTIITVQCLCSIPTPQTVIAELYPLLKPGGRWLVFEHVKTKNEGSLVWYGQKIFGRVWPHFFNGCEIDRPTDDWLLQAGEWREVDLRPGDGEGPYDCVPHVIGTLTKR